MKAHPPQQRAHPRLPAHPLGQPLAQRQERLGLRDLLGLPPRQRPVLGRLQVLALGQIRAQPQPQPRRDRLEHVDLPAPPQLVGARLGGLVGDALAARLLEELLIHRVALERLGLGRGQLVGPGLLGLGPLHPALGGGSGSRSKKSSSSRRTKIVPPMLPRRNPVPR